MDVGHEGRRRGARHPPHDAAIDRDLHRRDDRRALGILGTVGGGLHADAPLMVHQVDDAVLELHRLQRLVRHGPQDGLEGLRRREALRELRERHDVAGGELPSPLPGHRSERVAWRHV